MALDLLDDRVVEDVDALRAHLLEVTADAFVLADELAFAVETGVSQALCQRHATNYRQMRHRVRALRSLIRIQEGR